MQGNVSLCVFAALAVGTVLAAPGARADDAQPPDKSGFTLFNPTPAADVRALCTDRPTKSTSPCTVDAGHWQIESDVYNFTNQDSGGVDVTTQLITNPTLKLGLTNTWDVEVNIVPYEVVAVHERPAGTRQTFGGVGDLFVRTKINLLGDDGGSVGLALEPFIKAPTSPKPIGNGAVEAGVVAPIQFNLPMNWQLVLDPEADALADSNGPGRHLNLIGLASLTFPVTKTITLSGEIWGDENFDPAGHVTQASFDLGAAWIPAKSPNFQLDGGVNLGLNNATPGVQAYLGVSRRW
jgi:hypothetical protein